MKAEPSANNQVRGKQACQSAVSAAKDSFTCPELRERERDSKAGATSSHFSIASRKLGTIEVALVASFKSLLTTQSSPSRLLFDFSVPSFMIQPYSKKKTKFAPIERRFFS